MKKCPICGSMSFDDAKTCFGCMHGFASEETEGLLENESSSLPVAEPPARLEIPLVKCEPSEGVVDEGSGYSDWSDSVRAARDAVVPVPSRRSGREMLRRRGMATTQTESACRAGISRQVVVPEDGARYELVVSLQPVQTD